MSATIKLALLAALGTAVLAAPASAATYQPRGKYVSVQSAGTHVKRARAADSKIYLLEDNGNTNAAENFQDQFNVDY